MTQGLDVEAPIPNWDSYVVPPPGFFGRVFGAQQRYEDQVQAAREKYERDRAAVSKRIRRDVTSWPRGGVSTKNMLHELRLLPAGRTPL